MNLMAKYKWHAFLLGMLAFLSSCDVVKYVAVNNYGPPQVITVAHNPKTEILWESDTLYTGDIDGQDFENIIVRTNLDSATYWFIAPANSHTELIPKAWENPIRQVTVNNGPDKIVISLTDKVQLKKLKKQGIIETSGLPENMILINVNKPELETGPEPAPENPTVPEKGIEQAP